MKLLVGVSVFRITANCKIIFTSCVPIDRKYLLILSELGKDRENDMLERRTENNDC